MDRIEQAFTQHGHQPRVSARSTLMCEREQTKIRLESRQRAAVGRFIARRFGLMYIEAPIAEQVAVKDLLIGYVNHEDTDPPLGTSDAALHVLEELDTYLAEYHPTL